MFLKTFVLLSKRYALFQLGKIKGNNVKKREQISCNHIDPRIIFLKRKF